MTYSPYQANKNKNISQLHGFNVDNSLTHILKDEIKKELEEDAYFQKVQEKYANIAAKILDFAGNPAFDDFVMSLLNDTRGGSRQGFPDEIGVALMKLTRIHDKLLEKRA